MNQDNQNINNSPNEEIDLIRLLNYFKEGIKSIFKGIVKLFHYLFFLIFLLRKNWKLTIGMIVAGAFFGAFIKPMIEDSNVKYEMIVRGNPISNFELYAFGNEVNDQSENSDKEGAKLIRSMGISKMKIEPIERDEDVVNNYFEQVEISALRGIETDTLFFQGFEIKSHKSKMNSTDFALQRINITIDNDQTSISNIQEKIIRYFNELPSIRNDQENRLSVLGNYEKDLRKIMNNIDSILSSRAIANRKLTATGSEFMMNAATRNTVEADLLRYSEIFSKRIYGTQKLINSYQNGINVVSNLRPKKEESFTDNHIIKYALYGLVLAAMIILGLRFNTYLNRYENGKI